MEDVLARLIKWIPVFGEFEVDEQEIRFKGRRIATPALPAGPSGESKDQPMFGLSLSNRSLADGDVTAEVTFDNVTHETACELVVAYDPNASHIVAAGLGGEPSTLFAIREFGGPKMSQAWYNYRWSGERSNLRAGVPYKLAVKFRGANTTLLIDDVAVGTVEVTSPQGRPRQVGLLCRGDHVITIRAFAVHPHKPMAFVVMQFGAEYDDVYNDVVKEVCKTFEVNVLRADEVSGPGLIIRVLPAFPWVRILV